MITEACKQQVRSYVVKLWTQRVQQRQPKLETDLFKTAGTMHMCSRLQWQSTASMTVLKIRRRNSSKQACGRRTKGSQGIHDKIDPQQLDDSQGRLSFRDC